MEKLQKQFVVSAVSGAIIGVCSYFVILVSGTNFGAAIGVALVSFVVALGGMVWKG